MTINELIIELENRRKLHGGDTVVRTTWEGVVREINHSNVYFSDDGRWGGLWIDADNNAYKPKDAV